MVTQIQQSAPGPPEELAEGFVVGQCVVVILRKQVVHVVQPPLRHELSRRLGLLQRHGQRGSDTRALLTHLLALREEERGSLLSPTPRTVKATPILSQQSHRQPHQWYVSDSSSQDDTVGKDNA